MGKRKSESELKRFSWKRNKNYDILLLSEVQSRNPFAFKNSSKIWNEIAKTLQESDLKMKVTCRSCKDRVQDLLKIYRRNERRSNAASGIAEPEMTDIEKLLTEIDNLQGTGQNDQVRKIYARSDKTEAESIRDEALLAAQSSDSDNDDVPVASPPGDHDDLDDITYSNDALPSSFDLTSVNGRPVTPVIVVSSQVIDFDEDCTMIEDHIEIVDPNIDGAHGNNASNSVQPTKTFNTANTQKKAPMSSASGTNKSKAIRDMESTASLQMFFSDGGEDRDNDLREDQSEKMITKPSGRKANSKQDLIQYLEKKSDKELELRKDEMEFRKHELKMRELREATNLERELNIRKEEVDFRKEEVKIREKEMEIRQKEMENKSKELQILHDKTKGDIDNQKAMTELLMSLIPRKN